jgi:hypothetical protein
VSDDFSATTLSKAWTFTGAAGSGSTLGVSGGEKYLEFQIPNGNFDLYRTITNAPRLMQKAPDGDFAVEARFLSTPKVKNQGQGILVQEDADSWIRFDTYSDGSTLKAFAAVTLDGVTSNKINLAIAGNAAPYLKVTHTGDTWSFAHSTDGASWKTAGSFVQKLDVNHVGPFAGGVNSPFTARVDYFENLAAPILNEDGSVTSSTSAPSSTSSTGLQPVFSRLGDMEFTGKISDVVNIPHQKAFEIDQGAIAFSFEADRVDIVQGLISKDAYYYAGGGNHFSALIQNGEIHVLFTDADSDAIIWTSGIKANTEHDVLATFDEQAVKLWVDGRLVGSGALDMDWSDNSQWLQVGGLGWGRAPGASTASTPFYGTISDVMIFDQALAPADLGLV